MAWISIDEYLTQSQMENNADIIIEELRGRHIDDNTIAALLGNMQRESTLSPGLTERGGGGGYGLIQWTPQSVLINNCSTLGISPYTSGDVQLQVVLAEIEGTLSGWYSSEGFIDNYYNSGATPDMIGLTGSDFLSNSMGWNVDKLTVAYMVCRERPSFDPSINAYQLRQEYARNWLEYMGGIAPPTPVPTINKRNHFNFVLFNRRRRRYGQANIFR